MKKIFKKIAARIRRRYYLRLYRRLFMLYTGKGYDADMAGTNAELAFQWLTAIEYKELFKHLPKPDV